jgi:hypothetical protein
MNLKTIVIEMLPGRRWDAAARWAPVPLRLIVGYGFMEHGFAKLASIPLNTRTDKIASITGRLGYAWDFARSYLGCAKTAMHFR